MLKNQVRIFVEKNKGMLGVIVGIVLLGIILLTLPGLIQLPENPTRQMEATATMGPGDETVVVVVTGADETLFAMTVEVEQSESQPSTATTEIETHTATASAIPIPTATPTLTATPTYTPTPTPQPSATPTFDPSIPPPNPTLGSRWTRPSDNMVMLYVPGGNFLMGGDPAGDPNVGSQELPQHDVTLDSFWIDRTEVTNEQYALCVQEGSCQASFLADDSNFNGDSQPVVGISSFDAEAYCALVGGQLPTEAQWEYAARGDDRLFYPWGNEPPTCELAQFFGCDGDTMPVGSFSPAGDSWVGAADMVGNVREWAADWYDSGYYANSPNANPIGPENGDYRAVRGGGWTSFEPFLRSAHRNYENPDRGGTDLGFRCSAPGQ